MFARVPLDRILDNSFQTRAVYDGIEELADSIARVRAARPETSGLIQVPPARVVLGNKVLDIEEYGGVRPCLLDEPEARVELAAGHRRFRAFQYLHIYGDGGLNSEYETFPVEIQVLDDQAMANMAWEENRRRKDLSPIEEAQALRRAMERFGWTQTEVGERWGLSQSAVANKLRLLQLPEEAQAAIQAGQLSERHGRALLKAMGKSARIYALVAEAVIPVAVEADVAARARELMEAHRFVDTSRSLIPGIEEARCDVCGASMMDGLNGEVWQAWEKEGRHYLCWTCYRAGVGWGPPSVAETEAEVERSIRRESQRLDGATWPLEMAVGEGDLLVVQARCDQCDDRDDVLCLNSACFLSKKELWVGYQMDKLHQYLRERFPDAPPCPIERNWGGYDLSAYSDADRGLVEDGVCAPGRCARLRFRYVSYESDGQIMPCAGLPFVYNCNNTNSHHACERRYLRSQETDEEQAAAKEAERQAEGRRKEARGFLRRAELSVSRALQAGHEGAWRELAGLMGEKTETGQPVEASALMVAKAMLRGKDQMGWIEWELESAVGAFEAAIKHRLKDIGVGMMPGVEDLVRKLERIQGFLLGEDGLPRASLAPEQIRGNLDNLNRLAADVEAVVTSEQDRERLLGWVRGVQELFPGK